ncbi:DUF218 domain-containing protein [Candidatus Uhrbacteria bacterium]|jgi:SanA protein|nr:DUF218 domain-containing protein [Candidatus Uhrbacteria bacterium]
MNKIILAVFLAAILSIGFFNVAQSEIGAASEWIIERPQQVSVAIVPGASVLKNGSPSDILADRLLTAVSLYETGYVEKILVSGDGSKVDYNEVVVMERYLLDAGVPSEAILADSLGLDSFDTMKRAQEIFGVQSAIVTSQEYHLPRILYIGRGLGMEVYGMSSDWQPYVKADEFAKRERYANVKALFEMMLH